MGSSPITALMLQWRNWQYALVLGTSSFGSKGSSPFWSIVLAVIHNKQEPRNLGVIWKTVCRATQQTINKNGRSDF